MSEQNDGNKNGGTPPAAASARVPAPLMDGIDPAWSHLKPEEIVELQAARRETLAAQKAADEARARVLELESSTRDLHRQESVRDAFLESGVKFYEKSDALKLLEIEYDSENRPSVNGVSLATALQELALAHPELADGRSLRSLKEKREAANPTPKSKADFKDVASKNSFIRDKGLAAWEALPNRPPVTLSGIPNREMWRHMSVSQKIQVVDRHGAGMVARILKGEFDK